MCERILCSNDDHITSFYFISFICAAAHTCQNIRGPVAGAPLQPMKMELTRDQKIHVPIFVVCSQLVTLFFTPWSLFFSFRFSFISDLFLCFSLHSSCCRSAQRPTKKEKKNYNIFMQATKFPIHMLRKEYIGCAIIIIMISPKKKYDNQTTQNEAAVGIKEAVNWFRFAFGCCSALHNGSVIIGTFLCGECVLFRSFNVLHVHISPHMHSIDVYHSRYEWQPMERGQ